MATGTLISVDEYLATSYSPDKEYVDGVLVERIVGDWLHSLIQSNLIFAFRNKYPTLKVVGELRSKVTPTRYRLPDVSVLLNAPSGRVHVDPALIAIEILSEDDTFNRLIEKLKEYEAIGTANIWVFEPVGRLMFVFQDNALREITGDSIATTDGRFALTREEIFRD